MGKTVECLGLFGLGITSANTIFTKLNKSKSLEPVLFVPLGGVLKRSKARVVIFDSLKTFLENISNTMPHQVLIVSDVPVLLQTFPTLVPLDFTNPRSFEFRFNEPNLALVLQAAKRKNPIEFPMLDMDHLGFYIDTFKQEDDTIQRFLRLLMGLPHNTRERIRESIYAFLVGKAKFKVIQETLKTYVPAEMSDLSYQFVELFKTQAVAYREAIESDKPPKVLAKQLKLDEYGISFFKKLVRSQAFVATKKKVA